MGESGRGQERVPRKGSTDPGSIGELPGRKVATGGTCWDVVFTKWMGVLGGGSQCTKRRGGKKGEHWLETLRQSQRKVQGLPCPLGILPLGLEFRDFFGTILADMQFCFVCFVHFCLYMCVEGVF